MFISPVLCVASFLNTLKHPSIFFARRYPQMHSSGGSCTMAQRVVGSMAQDKRSILWSWAHLNWAYIWLAAWPWHCCICSCILSAYIVPAWKARDVDARGERQQSWRAETAWLSTSPCRRDRYPWGSGQTSCKPQQLTGWQRKKVQVQVWMWQYFGVGTCGSRAAGAATGAKLSVLICLCLWVTAHSSCCFYFPPGMHLHGFNCAWINVIV